MTRDMFLNELRIALQGQIGQAQVNEQLAYYETYIIEESRKGRTEGEVLESLGSPRLIAKTVIQIYGSPVDMGAQAGSQTGYSNVDGGENREWRKTGRLSRIQPGLSKLLSVMLSVICLLLIFRIGIIVLPFLASVFLIGAICYIIFLIFFGNKK
ncbi:MAG: DUF1700 domain-containing protein [Eubacterium sp.]|jgi:uncharacterized membrane protein|nr:DUF1700 domain-containing protein [Eubacterium sp.]NBI86121.1 DUF1700 domain-containing protein [Lachnospiraceae bacterium]